MNLATCYPCSKYLLAILNLFFWLSGLTFIILGFYFLLQPEVQHVIHLLNLTSLPLSSIELSACVLIVIGLFIFFIGLFGYCGARRESRTCLIFYMFLVSFVLVAELVLFILITLYYDQGQRLLKERLISQMKTYNHHYPSPYERAIDSIQDRYQCCGLDSAYDYGTFHVPHSCCSSSSNPSCTNYQVGLIGTPGCSHLLIQTSLFWTKFFLTFEVGLCLFALLGVFLAICVCQHSMIYDGYTQTFYSV